MIASVLGDGERTLISSVVVCGGCPYFYQTLRLSLKQSSVGQHELLLLAYLSFDVELLLKPLNILKVIFRR